MISVPWTLWLYTQMVTSSVLAGIVASPSTAGVMSPVQVPSAVPLMTCLPSYW